MGNPIVDSLLESIKQGVIDSARQMGVAELGHAETDAKSFLALAVPTIERWVKAFFSNPQVLTKDELEVLVEDLAYDALAHVVKLGGMAEIEAEKTKNTILKIATGIASSAIGKLIPI